MLQVLCGYLVCYILEFIVQLLYLYHWIYNYSYILLDLCMALGDGFYVHIIMLNVKFVWFALPFCFLFSFLGAFETNTCVVFSLFKLLGCRLLPVLSAAIFLFCYSFPRAIL